MLFVGWYVLVVVCWLLCVVCCLLFVVCCALFVVLLFMCWFIVVGSFLVVDCWLLFVVGCLRIVVVCVLFDLCCLSVGGCWYFNLFVDCWWLCVVCCVVGCCVFFFVLSFGCCLSFVVSCHVGFGFGDVVHGLLFGRSFVMVVVSRLLFLSVVHWFSCLI